MQEVEVKGMRSLEYGRAMLWAALGAVFIACYYQTFLWLNYKYSAAESYFSHGYLIPLISAYLIYQRRDEIARTELSGSRFGLAVILAALIIHLFGVLSNVNFISAFSMILFLAGCSLYLLGRAVTRKIAFPLFYLVFMCPIPDAFINTVALPSKSAATAIALKIIDLIGIPYIQEGFRIVLVHSAYIVGAPCNGMRSIISFLALGVLFLYIIRSSLWKKLMFLAAIPFIAVFLNGIRIAILLFVAHRYGQEAASPESYLHDGSGLLVFFVGLVLMMIASRYINEDKKS